MLLAMCNVELRIRLEGPLKPADNCVLVPVCLSLLEHAISFLTDECDPPNSWAALTPEALLHLRKYLEEAADGTPPPPPPPPPRARLLLTPVRGGAGPAVLEYAADAGTEQPPLCSGEAEAEAEPLAGAELLVVVCRFLALWYAEVSSDAYAGKLCRAIPTLCGDGAQWGGQEECRLQGLARLLPALAPLASRPDVADALLAARCIPHAAGLLQQVPPTHLQQVP